MTVTSANVQDIREEDGKKYVRVIFDVTSGTYIRSLAEELGHRLGIPATLSNLRRISIGRYHINVEQLVNIS